MKQLIFAATALLVAILLSGNALAMTGSEAKGLYTPSQAMKVRHGCCHRRGCSGCVAYRYTVYRSCGRGDLYAYTTYQGCGDYGYNNYRCGCGCGHCSCGYGYGGCGSASGWSLYRW